MHKAQQHKDAVYPFACTSCEYNAVNQQNLIAHLKLHSDEKPYPCHICSYRAKNRTGINAHLKRKNHSAIRSVRISYKCAVCPHQTSTPSDLRNHIITHIRSPDLIRLELLCMCGYVTKFEEIPIHINDHVKNVLHSEIDNLLIQFVCNIIDGVDDQDANMYNAAGVVDNTNSLLQHPNVPLGYKNTSFNYTGNTQGPLESQNWLHEFPPQHDVVSNLPPIHTINNTFHTDPAPSQSNPSLYEALPPPHASPNASAELMCMFCNYVAYNDYDLMCHTSTHSNVYDTVSKMPTWYNCSMCGFKAESENDLTLHMNTHVDFKYISSIDYMCEVCGYSGYSQSDLDVHKTIHTNEEPVKCKQCGYIAITMGDLRLHMIMHPSAEDLGDNALDSDSEGVDSPYFNSDAVPEPAMMNHQDYAISAPGHI